MELLLKLKKCYALVPKKEKKKNVAGNRALNQDLTALIARNSKTKEDKKKQSVVTVEEWVIFLMTTLQSRDTRIGGQETKFL